MKCVSFSSSWTSTTAAVNALNDLSFFQFRLWYATDAIRTKVCVSCLNASKATKIFVSRFLPFCDQVSVGDFLLQAIFVKFARNNFTSNIHVVNVSRLLVMNFEDWPQWFVDSFAFVWFGLSYKINILWIFKRLGLFLLKLPSLIFWSILSSVSSIKSHPSGGRLRLLLTFGIFLVV